ncbi:serine/threonine protein phosphatase [Brachybacterium hainanense]|uniref:Serine/threonine protein phosphatase n=1 Tax=Brachybacterium hainanense TaxID=1541174 RepID=A0ABV6R9K9_9MICO
MTTIFDHLRSDDGEHVGYLEITEDDQFIPYDLLRERRGEPMDLDEAEAVLDAIGLRMLAEDWLLTTPGEESVRVRIQEVTREAVTVAPTLDGGSIHVAKTVDLTATLRLSLPTDRLQPLPR